MSQRRNESHNPRAEKKGRKNGRVSLHPLRFEDALRALLETEPPKESDERDEDGTVTEWSNESYEHDGG